MKNFKQNCEFVPLLNVYIRSECDHFMILITSEILEFELTLI